jgi:hypothetical protein
MGGLRIWVAVFWPHVPTERSAGRVVPDLQIRGQLLTNSSNPRPPGLLGSY